MSDLDIANAPAIAAGDQDTAAARSHARAVAAFYDEVKKGGVPNALAAGLTHKWFDSYLIPSPDWDEDDAA